MINNVVLVGRITRKPELRYTPQNQAVATFSLAVNRQFKNANGEREADFINCVIWRQQAENLSNWANKGSLIGITGRIQTRNYENQQGQRVYVTEVVADSFQMLESRSNRGGVDGQNTPAPAQQNGNNMNYKSSDSTPQGNFSSEVPDMGKPNFFDGKEMEISDDDLPF